MDMFAMVVGMAMLVVNSGALVMLGGIRSDVKHLRRSDVKLEGRVEVLEQQKPTPPAPLPLESGRSSEA